MKLIIGNKNYSSWSLRAWLLLSAYEVPFTEERILLSLPGTAAEIGKYNEAGKVPVLHDDGLIIWDSLAICEYVSERYLDGKGWPASLEKRAQARSCAAEMHSGFFHLREDMPMNCRADERHIERSAALQKDIDRIDNLWQGLRKENAAEGPWLFGTFSIADCMFAPVAFRFATYGVELSEESQEYAKSLLNHPEMQLWLSQARQETEVIEAEEVGRK
ncbi:MAG: glutathione S-transferase family protein [Desulfocapsaceae bacterium]|nr:glutathione S-transferase family protein [Desulfocapsaceae bacterium]